MESWQLNVYVFFLAQFSLTVQKTPLFQPSSSHPQRRKLGGEFILGFSYEITLNILLVLIPVWRGHPWYLSGYPGSEPEPPGGPSCGCLQAEQPCLCEQGDQCHGTVIQHLSWKCTYQQNPNPHSCSSVNSSMFYRCSQAENSYKIGKMEIYSSSQKFADDWRMFKPQMYFPNRFSIHLIFSTIWKAFVYSEITC